MISDSVVTWGESEYNSCLCLYLKRTVHTVLAVADLTDVALVGVGVGVGVGALALAAVALAVTYKQSFSLIQSLP